MTARAVLRPTPAARLTRWAVPAVAIVLVAALHPVSAAAAGADDTWQGGAGTDVQGALWSDAANWVGGSIPADDAGQLTFPALSSDSCTYATCYNAENDLTGISVEGLTINDRYALGGDALRLGASGITAQTDGPSVIWVDAPLVLTAPQSWTIDDGADGWFETGAVTSDSSLAQPASLTIDLAGSTLVG